MSKNKKSYRKKSVKKKVKVSNRHKSMKVKRRSNRKTMRKSLKRTKRIMKRTKNMKGGGENDSSRLELQCQKCEGPFNSAEKYYDKDSTYGREPGIWPETDTPVCKNCRAEIYASRERRAAEESTRPAWRIIKEIKKRNLKNRENDKNALRWAGRSVFYGHGVSPEGDSAELLLNEMDPNEKKLVEKKREIGRAANVFNLMAETTKRQDSGFF
jgi:hypothetical protein